MPFDSTDLLVALGRDDGWEEKQEAVKVRAFHIASLLPSSGGSGKVRRQKKAPANLTIAGEIGSKIDHAKLLLSVLTLGLALPSRACIRDEAHSSSPSRLALNRPEGSFNAAPLAKVILTWFLYVSSVETMPPWDQTGSPLHSTLRRYQGSHRG